MLFTFLFGKKKFVAVRFFGITMILILSGLRGQSQSNKVNLVNVDSGWARNSVNVVVFRKNSLVTFHDWQYIAFYNKEGSVVIGKRKLNAAKWEFKKTGFKGNAADAHNMISIMIDGNGYLHMSWNHHNNQLHYARGIEPGSLLLTGEMPMTGLTEKKVCYPEFYKMPDGNLIFLYRDGGSGDGNLVINQYDIKTKTWKQLHNKLIDGEHKRSPYWQSYIDAKGTIHLSWVWRENVGVQGNHDMAYACSKDGGVTWERSDGSKYQLPINLKNAETIVNIPCGSELMNQTSMFADSKGFSYIASYWKEGSGVPEYHVTYKTIQGWRTDVVGKRVTDFTLQGGLGTKYAPMSRPQIIAWNSGKKVMAAMFFCDKERGNRVSVAVNRDLGNEKWKIIDLLPESVGSWEPTYDTELWKEKGLLHLFVQNVKQEDSEGLSDMPPQIIKVLEWNPKKIIH